MVRYIIYDLSGYGESCHYIECADIEPCVRRGMLDLLAWEIRSYRPEVFIDLVEWLDRYRKRIEPLISIYMLYDMSLAGWVSSHEGMSRRLARLKKLKRIVLEAPYLETEHCIVGIYNLAKHVLQILDMVIDALEAWKDEVHRVRDRVHTLVYPLLRGVLEALATPCVVYRYGDQRYAMRLAYCGGKEIKLCIERRGYMYLGALSREEGIELARKLARRISRERTLKPVEEVAPFFQLFNS